MVQYNVRDHGAAGDGGSDDTAAVQAAVDACAAGGGGTVVVPSGGTFRIGSVTLRSFVELHIERGATLTASPDFADYSVRHPGVVTNDWSAGDGWAGIETSVMIDADGAEDVAITGGGMIDGGGRHFVEEDLGPIYRMDEHRPFTIYLRNSRGVTIRDVAIVDGALWTLRLSRCDDVVIHGIRIRNDLKLPNSDGIDLDACRRVRISDCDIVAGDDAICLKTCRESVADGRVCEDITVTGCTITTTSSALILGSENQSAIRNVVFSSCVIRASNRGLAIRAHEKGSVANILFSDITVETRFFDDRWWGRGEPIYVTAIPTRDRAGAVRNVRFRNILVRSENGVLVHARGPGSISGVTFQDVRLEIDRWSGRAGGTADLRPCPDPGLVPMTLDAFHIENAGDVTLRDCEVVWTAAPDDARHALLARDAPGLVVAGLRANAAHPELDEAAVVEGVGTASGELVGSR